MALPQWTLDLLKPNRDEKTGRYVLAGASFCHPEPAKTAKDLSRGDEVTRMIECVDVNPDATIVTARLVIGCDVDFE